MSRAYFVLIRKDIEDNGLQIFDLKPNSSQYVPALESGPQTGYLGFTVQNDTVATTGATVVTNAAYKGLAAYLIDNVADGDNLSGGDPTVLTDTRANTLAAAILSHVVAGNTLTAEDVETLIQGVTGGTDSPSDLSTYTVEGIVRVLGGHVYKIPAGVALAESGRVFAEGRQPVGSFVTSEDADYRHIREYVNTGALQLSCDQGQCAKLRSSTFKWINPVKSYGAGGTAKFIDGTSIPATGEGAALVVYTADGHVIGG